MNQRRALEASAAPLWIGEARDHLKIAGNHEPGLNLRRLCSEAHLGAEKAVKGVMIARGEVSPYTHDIGLLLDQAARIDSQPPVGQTWPGCQRRGKRFATSITASGRASGETVSPATWRVMVS